MNKKRGEISIAILLLTSLLIGSFSAGFFKFKKQEKEISILKQEVQSNQKTLNLSGFSPAGGITYRLRTSIGTTDTSINLTSLKNRSDIPLTMTVLGTDIGYGTLSPQTSRSEFISFTGITQNANGTAQLTGVTRGLSDITPFTASTTLRESHPGQSIFILSDSPQLFEEYALRRSTQFITGGWGFQTAPTSTTCANPTELCNKAYVDATSNQGAATSTEINGGIVELATALEAASSTEATVNVEKPRVLYAKYSTSSPYATGYTAAGGNVGPGLVIPVTQGSSTLSSTFIDQTAGYAWTGTTTFSASTTFTAFQNATTTFSSKVNFGNRVMQDGTLGGITPVGSVTAFASSTAPRGWLQANGQSIAVATYPDLFSLIGYTYGGAGANFNVPDIRNRQITMASTTHNGGLTGGEANHTQTESELVAHTHVQQSMSGGGGSTRLTSDSSGTTNTAANSTQSTGGGLPFNVLDPYINLYYIIKY